MGSTFSGFPPQALSFFRQLAKNNKREWFHPRKARFEEQVRGPMLELVALINDDLRSFAADHVTEPGKALYRIYRDTRFSNDKTPYKTHIGALFPRPGLDRHAGASFYVGVSHTGVDIGGGIYQPGPVELAAVRKAIESDEAGFRRAIGDKALRKAMGELRGDKLARVPRGHAPDHPAGDLLRLKRFYFFTTLPPEAALTPSLRREVVKRFRAAAPFVHYLNAIVLSAVRSDDAADPIAVRPAPMF